MKQIKAILIGAGQRGYACAAYAKPTSANAQECKDVAAAAKAKGVICLVVYTLLERYPTKNYLPHILNFNPST